MTRRPMTIVAEAAQGYEGDPALARLLAQAAARAGADLVKFQLVFADELATPAYQHYRLFQQLEMPEAGWQEAADAARGRVGLAFDVFGERSLDLALRLGAAAVKVHSTDFFNHALVSAALARAPRVLFSAGGIEPAELDAFIARHDASLDRLVLMYGFQAEPTAIGDNHLARLGALAARYPRLALGFMDHADGDADDASWLGVLAVPLGAQVIEKHLTLDRGLELEDYVSALAPAAFAGYVARVRAAAAALGDPALAPGPAEQAYRRRALKAVVARHRLEAGARLTAGDLQLLRTALEEGRTPLHRLDQAEGRTLTVPRAPGEALYEGDVR